MKTNLARKKINELLLVEEGGVDSVAVPLQSTQHHLVTHGIACQRTTPPLFNTPSHFSFSQKKGILPREQTHIGKHNKCRNTTEPVAGFHRAPSRSFSVMSFLMLVTAGLAGVEREGTGSTRLSERVSRQPDSVWRELCEEQHVAEAVTQLEVFVGLGHAHRACDIWTGQGADNDD